MSSLKPCFTSKENGFGLLPRVEYEPNIKRVAGRDSVVYLRCCLAKGMQFKIRTIAARHQEHRPWFCPSQTGVDAQIPYKSGKNRYEKPER